MGRRACLGLLLPALVLSGCFDVQHVAADPVVLDDFDDGNFYPTDPDFDPWQCASFNQAGNDYNCDLAPGNQSLRSLALQATVVDPMDDVKQSGGALLKTTTPWPLDFTSVTEIDFEYRLAFDFDAPTDASLNLEIGCTTAEAEDGSAAGDLFVEMEIPPQSSWTPFQARTDELINPDWPNTKKVKGGAPACLKLADSVRFSVDTALPDGATGGFTLNVDDIVFR